MADVVKPGTSTSEFKLSAVVGSLIALVPAFVPRIADVLTPDVQAWALAALAGLYTLGRSIVKAFAKGPTITPPTV